MMLGFDDEIFFGQNVRYDGYTVREILENGEEGREYLKWCLGQGVTFTEAVEDEL